MSKQRTIILLLIIQIIYFLGAVLIALMDNDATQYATIAMQMCESGSFLEVAYRNSDYLDKPPLLFWLSSLSFSAFGVSQFAYRLPSLIINVLGIYATFKLAELLYGKHVALLAALIYASAFGIVLFNHDVRTDTMLTAFVIFSIWQLMVYIKNGKIVNFVFGFAGIGMAMLVKGPIGLMVPTIAIGCQLIYSKQWKFVFQWRWLIGLLIILIILSPMLVGLYNQHGIEGIEFYFWTQSFGRLTGENVWVNTSGSLFFVHSFLWSFLPWTLLALVAYIRKWKIVIRDVRSTRTEEILTLGGITLVFIAMSLSQYKLPHYIFVVYPLIAILTASLINDFVQDRNRINLLKAIPVTQNIVNLLIWVVIIFVCLFVFPLSSIFIWAMILMLLASFIVSIINKIERYIWHFYSKIVNGHRIGIHAEFAFLS